MYKSRTMREISAEQGITRFGSNKSLAQKRMLMTGIGQGRWNKGKLPKGSNRKLQGTDSGTEPRT